jgi:hypothetical protein
MAPILLRIHLETHVRYCWGLDSLLRRDSATGPVSAVRNHIFTKVDAMRVRQTIV